MLKARIKKTLKTFKNILLGKKAVHDENFIGFDKYQISGAYHWDTINNNEFYRQKAVEVLNQVEANNRCLDVGCGDGAVSGFVAKKAKFVVGVDADVDAIQLAQKQSKKFQVSNCAFHHAPMSKIDHELFGNKEKFDFLYSLDVIEHLPKPEQLLEVGLKVLNKNAKIVIGTPLFITKELVSPYHVKEFNLTEIREILEKHMIIKEEKILPEKRLDGKVYEKSFYMAIGSPKL